MRIKPITLEIEMPLKEITKFPKFSLASKMNNIQFKGLMKVAYIGTKTLALLAIAIDLVIYTKNATYGNVNAFLKNRTLKNLNIGILERNKKAKAEAEAEAEAATETKTEKCSHLDMIEKDALTKVCGDMVLIAINLISYQFVTFLLV